MFEEQINLSTIIENAVEFIEKNQNILKYGDLTLYEHQKDIFTDMMLSDQSVSRAIHLPNTLSFLKPDEEISLQ